jgi:hypothetical protein
MMELLGTKVMYTTTTEVSGMEKIPYGLYSKELRKEAVKNAALGLPSRYSCYGKALAGAASPSFILIGRQIISFESNGNGRPFVGGHRMISSHAGEGTASATVKAETV